MFDIVQAKVIIKKSEIKVNVLVYMILNNFFDKMNKNIGIKSCWFSSHQPTTMHVHQTFYD